jgi:hypothetical protein
MPIRVILRVWRFLYISRLKVIQYRGLEGKDSDDYGE